MIRVRHDDVDRTVHVYNMHLGLARFERRIQLRTFLDSHPFANLHHETPIVVGGDLNDVYGRLGELLQPAGFRGIERRPLTFPAWGPVRPLDAIFVRGNVDFVGCRAARASSRALQAIIARSSPRCACSRTTRTTRIITITSRRHRVPDVTVGG